MENTTSIAQLDWNKLQFPLYRCSNYLFLTGGIWLGRSELTSTRARWIPALTVQGGIWSSSFSERNLRFRRSACEKVITFQCGNKAPFRVFHRGLAKEVAMSLQHHKNTSLVIIKVNVYRKPLLVHPLLLHIAIREFADSRWAYAWFKMETRNKYMLPL